MESTVLPPAEPQLFFPANDARTPPILRKLRSRDDNNVWTLRPEADEDETGLFRSHSQFQQIIRQIESELQHLAVKPELVVFPAPMHSWHADYPINSRTLVLVTLFAEHGIPVGITCRSLLSRGTSELLAEHCDLVRLHVPVMSADVTVQKALEPHAALLPERLKMASELRELGIQVQVAIEPIMPNLTDSRQSLEDLLEKIAKYGFNSVTAGYLCLRQGQKDQVHKALEPHGWSELVLSAFNEALVTREPGQRPTTYLAKGRRQRGYATLMSIAAPFDIEVRLSRSANPDFQSAKAPEAPASARFQAFIRSLRQSRSASDGQTEPQRQ